MTSPDGRQPSHNPIAPLLETLGRDHLDPGYAEAAARKRATGTGALPPTRRSTRPVAMVVAGCLVAGVVLGVAAWRTESNAPRAENTRSALLEDIDRAQERQSLLATSAAGLAEELRASQSAAGAAGPVAQVTELENQGQLTPVVGPGLRIVLAQPSAADPAQDRTVILDRDLQLLVNDLWAAGAEAIAIGGVRLNTRSAIRQAGGAILVDNRPVFWPLAVEAVGDPSAMQVKLISGPSYGRFSSFAQLYGIEFDLSAQQDLNLPGGSAPDLLHAQPVTTASAAQPTR